MAIARAIDVARLRVDDMKLSSASDQPYADMARAFVRSFTAELEQWAIDNVA